MLEINLPFGVDYLEAKEVPSLIALAAHPRVTGKVFLYSDSEHNVFRDDGLNSDILRAVALEKWTAVLRGDICSGVLAAVDSSYLPLADYERGRVSVGILRAYLLKHEFSVAVPVAMVEPQPTAMGVALVQEIASDKFTKSSANVVASAKPWLTPNPDDPLPLQPWFTPARYFARKLVVEDSNLLSKRLILAAKVSKSLSDVGVLKRGNKKKFAADTVLKALININLA